MIRIAAFVLVAAWLTPTRASAAEQAAPTRLEVERSPEAQDCPDANWFAGRVRQVIDGYAIEPADPGNADTTSSLYVRVRIDQTSGYVATIEVAGRRSGQRTISDSSSTCEGLADALAVTLTIILDEIRVADSPPPPSPAPVQPPQPKSPKAAPRRRPPGIFQAEIGAGAGIAVLDAVTSLFSGGISLHFGRARLGTGVWFLPERSYSTLGGEVTVGMVAEQTKVCFDVARIGSVSFDVCGRGALGALHAEGRGFNSDRSAVRPWLALGGSIFAVGALGRTWAWTGEFALLAPLRDERFIVDGRGVAFDAPSISGVLVAGVAASLL